MLKRSFNHDLSGKTKTSIIYIFLLFLSSLAFALDSLEVVMTFESTSGAFITSFDGADFNNDGFSDLIISNNSERMLQFYFGSADPDPILDLEYEMPFKYGSGQPSWAGDLNGDGWNDLVVPIMILDFQLIYIFFGADTINIDFDNPDILLNSWDYAPDTWGLYWYGKNTGTDFNGDGYDDLIASGEGPEMFYFGQVDIFFGGEEMDTIVDFNIQGEYLNQFGKYNAVGDINGDGYDDLIASRNIEGDIDPHKYEIYLGGPEMDTVMDYELQEIYYGGSCTANGDLNGDGYYDFIIGDGNVYIYWGNPDTNLVCDSIDINHWITKVFYCNLNNDIYEDLVAFNHISNYENYLYIYYGKENFETNCNPDIVTSLIGNFPPNSSDWCCNNLGDFNQDGRDEIIITNGYPFHYATVYTLAGGQGIDDNHESGITNKELMKVYPNPFMDSTTISFYGTTNSHELSQIKIFNLRGQLIKELKIQNLNFKINGVVWDGKDEKGQCLPFGIYFAEMKTGKDVNVVKMVKIGR